MQETPVPFLGWEDPLQEGQVAHSSILGFPGDLADKESTCNVGDLGSIPGLGRSPEEGKGYPLQYFALENPMDYSPGGHKESDKTQHLSSMHALNPVVIVLHKPILLADTECSAKTVIGT